MDRKIGSFSPERFERLISDKRQRILRNTPHQEEDLLVLESPKKPRNRRVADTSNFASPSSSLPVQASSSLPVQVQVNPPIQTLANQPVQAHINQPTMAQPSWIQHNASPISFQQYHDLPKDPMGFCSKFFVNDPNRTTEEHVKVFEEALCNQRILHEDIACRLFPYSLSEEPY